MAKYRISHGAQADIVDILRFTHNRFGDAARRRYQALIGAALEAVATDPQQVGSISREELGAGLRSIHLVFCVYCRSMPNVGKVVRPRHFVFYRVATDQVLEVVRVLHDSMELERHLARNRLR
uniref:type II toxin-antitoxin system RelE/ParE family toxin n=1 Tax=Pseudomonas aeruginosa TaxID=287 RepID=UPI00356A84DB